MTESTYELYRCPTGNSAGASKDWAITVSGNSHISVQYGTTGKKLRTSEIKDVKGRAFDSFDEMRSRIAKKLSEGYEYVGKIQISDTGKQTPGKDVETKSWSFTDFSTPQLLQVLSAFTEDVNAYVSDLNNVPDDAPVLEVEFDANLRGLTFKCDGYLPLNGWFFGESIMPANPDRGLSDGGGVINYPIQELLLSALNPYFKDGDFSAVVEKGGVERGLIAGPRGFVTHFVDEVGLPRNLVQYIGTATGGIPKPLALFAQEVEVKASAICF